MSDVIEVTGGENIAKRLAILVDKFRACAIIITAAKNTAIYEINVHVPIV